MSQPLITLAEYPLGELQRLIRSQEAVTYEVRGRLYRVRPRHSHQFATSDPRTRIYNGWSLRYLTLARSADCAVCRARGDSLLLQIREDVSIPTAHFNMYAAGILLTQDHIVPLCLGGADTLENSQTLCELCNALKGHRLVTPEQLRRELNARGASNVPFQNQCNGSLEGCHRPLCPTGHR